MRNLRQASANLVVLPSARGLNDASEPSLALKFAKTNQCSDFDVIITGLIKGLEDICTLFKELQKGN